jgi:HEAT repeat protein
VQRGCRRLNLGVKPARAVEQFRVAGVLVCPAGGQWMFVHRTFLEFLAAEHLGHGPRPLARVERFLWRPDRHGVRRWQQAVELLRRALRDPEVTVRWRAAGALGELGGKCAVEALRQALQDPEEWVRSTAADALAALGSECVLDVLLHKLESHPYVDDERKAALALLKLGSKRAVPPLLQAFTQLGKEARALAAKVLGVLGGEEALPRLRQTMKDPQAEVRRAAAFAVLKISFRAGQWTPPIPRPR